MALHGLVSIRYRRENISLSLSPRNNTSYFRLTEAQYFIYLSE